MRDIHVLPRISILRVVMLCDHSVDTFRPRYTLEKGTLMSSILIQTTLRGIEKEEGKMAL